MWFKFKPLNEHGHGLPGYIAACGPQFDEAVFKNFAEAQKALDEFTNYLVQVSIS